jgi:uncharacterized protein YegJ (DUF2314 family)
MIPLIFPAILFFWSCGVKAEPEPVSPVFIRDPVLHISQIDPDLHDISVQARENLTLFIERLQNPAEDEGGFRVKYPFQAEEGSGFRQEHIWLTDIVLGDEGRYYGVIANQPYYVTRFHPGDRVSFFIDDISDWMYLKGGRIIGGISIKYLIEQIPELDRDAETSAVYGLFE